MNEVERINLAKAEINAAINKAGTKYDLPPYVMELIVNAALSEIRGQINIIDTIERDSERRKKEMEEKEEDVTQDASRSTTETDNN